jgi:hypothetical protein
MGRCFREYAPDFTFRLHDITVKGDLGQSGTEATGRSRSRCTSSCRSSQRGLLRHLAGPPPGFGHVPHPLCGRRTRRGAGDHIDLPARTGAGQVDVGVAGAVHVPALGNVPGSPPRAATGCTWPWNAHPRPRHPDRRGAARQLPAVRCGFPVACLVALGCTYGLIRTRFYTHAGRGGSAFSWRPRMARGRGPSARTSSWNCRGSRVPRSSRKYQWPRW